MKNKVIITIEGGNIQFISSTDPKIEIFVVDYDLSDVGEEPLVQYAPDCTFKDGHAHELFMGSLNPVEGEIKDELKRLKV